MKSIPYNPTKNLLNMAITLFALNNKQKARKPQVYWVIDENDCDTSSVIIKYFDENDALLHQEVISGLTNGIMDEEVVLQLNQTKERVIKTMI
ncbi:MAG: hypothetical protein MUE85_00170 [Microscillaceae bacterium]|jgi:hypothetical protein|nr:hypothetical protein [Microscillaceae bacterium]